MLRHSRTNLGRQAPWGLRRAGRGPGEAGEYAAEWLDSKHKLKPSTRARYQVVLDNFIGGHSEVALGDISRQLIAGSGWPD